MTLVSLLIVSKSSSRSVFACIFIFKLINSDKEYLFPTKLEVSVLNGLIFIYVLEADFKPLPLEFKESIIGFKEDEVLKVLSYVATYKLLRYLDTALRFNTSVVVSWKGVLDPISVKYKKNQLVVYLNDKIIHNDLLYEITLVPKNPNEVLERYSERVEDLVPNI